jgi:hypothetical protein
MLKVDKQVFHEFRNFVQRINGALKDKNVRKYLGNPYKELLEGQLEVFDVSP